MPQSTLVSRLLKEIAITLAATSVCCILLGCSVLPITVPDEAKKSIATYAQERGKSNFTYTIISAQKATNLQYVYYRNYQEVLCVVTDIGIHGGGPEHFTIGRNGLLWRVVEEAAKDDFLGLGCSNW